MLLRLAIALSILLLPASARTQTAQKPIQIIVPFAPGASADGIGRLLASELALRLGRQVIVENKAGVGGALGLVLVAKSPPDGDTLAIAATGALVINPHISNASPADSLRDLVPVAKLIEIPIVVVANKDSGLKSIQDLIAKSKVSPGGMNYGSTGTNSVQHISMELLKQATGAKLVHVPYRGSAPAMTDLLGGQIPAACVDLTSAFPHIQAGTVIALGLADARRSTLVPNVPTIAEGGVVGFGREPGFIGLMAPAGTPSAVVKKLSGEIREILAAPTVRGRVRQLAVDVAYLDDAAFAGFLNAESAKWKRDLQTLGLSN